jgi:hypothetical protein
MSIMPISKAKTNVMKDVSVDNSARKAAIYFCYKSPADQERCWKGLSSAGKEQLISNLKDLSHSPYLPVSIDAKKALFAFVVEDICDVLHSKGVIDAQFIAQKIEAVTKDSIQTTIMIDDLSSKLMDHSDNEHVKDLIDMVKYLVWAHQYLGPRMETQKPKNEKAVNKPLCQTVAEGLYHQIINAKSINSDAIAKKIETITHDVSEQDEIVSDVTNMLLKDPQCEKSWDYDFMDAVRNKIGRDEINRIINPK